MVTKGIKDFLNDSEKSLAVDLEKYLVSILCSSH